MNKFGRRERRRDDARRIPARRDEYSSRPSVTAAGHASGLVPAEAEATPVVGNSAYRKSTPGRRAAGAYKARARVAPARLSPDVVGKSEEEVASHVRPSVSRSRSPSERDVAPTTTYRLRATDFLSPSYAAGTRPSSHAGRDGSTRTHTHRNTFGRVDIENNRKSREPFRPGARGCN